MSTPKTLDQSSNQNNLLSDVKKLPQVKTTSDPGKGKVDVDGADPQISALTLHPLDFTHTERYRVALRNIETPHDIMAVIKGPLINSLNYNNYAISERLQSNNGKQLFHDNLLNTAVHSVSELCSDGTYKITFNYHGQRVYVRRQYINQEAIVQLDWLKNNPYQRYRTALNQPQYSVLAYPNIMMAGEVDPVVRSISSAIAIRFLDGWSYTVPSSPPNITIRTLASVETGLSNGSLSGIPLGSIPLNLSTISQSDLGKLVYFGSYIIDMSNSHAGVVPAAAVSAYDPVIARILETTMSHQDLEWAHWYASSLLPMYSMSSTGNSALDYPSCTLPTPDPYEMIWTYLTEVHQYEGGNDCMSKWHGSQYGVALTLSYRVAKTYLHQQALKQLHIWLNTDWAMLKNITSSGQLNIMVGAWYPNLGTRLTDTKTVNNVEYHRFSLAWIPYEIPYCQGRDITIDDPMLRNSRSGPPVPTTCVRPPSVIMNNQANGLTFYNRWNESFDCRYLTGPGNLSVRAIPAYLYVYSGGDKDRSLCHTSVTFSSTDFIATKNVENTNYFPMPDIVSDV